MRTGLLLAAAFAVAYAADAKALDISDDLTITDESVRGFLRKFLDAFADWIGKVAGIVPEPGQPDGA